MTKTHTDELEFLAPGGAPSVLVSPGTKWVLSPGEGMEVLLGHCGDDMTGQNLLGPEISCLEERSHLLWP